MKAITVRLDGDDEKKFNRIKDRILAEKCLDVSDAEIVRSLIRDEKEATV